MSTELCGRPTKSGAPCRGQTRGYPELGIFKFACSTHETDQDRELSMNLRSAYLLGVERGKDSLKNVKDEIRRELSAEFNARECRHMRTHDSLGRQLVVVGSYTYHWGGASVVVGDTVTLPPSEWHPKNQGVVTAVVSDYSGTTRGLVSVP